MKMFFYRAAIPNFGDELNPWLWPKVLGDCLDDDDSQIFLGIGSILWNSFPVATRKVVFGAGYAGYTGKPDLHDGTWDVHFVRGPQTAEALNLDSATALTDAAVLVRTQPLPVPAPSQTISFMPHFESLARGRWSDVCAAAGVHLIDPTQPVEAVLAQIRGTRLLVTEAMHGAIVADSLRVPWIPLRPIAAEHRFKWLDWTRSVDVPYEPVALSPSSIRELWVYGTGGRGQGRFTGSLAASPVGHAVDAVLIPMTAARLQQIARREPYLSRDSVIERLTDRALEMVAGFRQRYARAPQMTSPLSPASTACPNSSLEHSAERP
jgi:succinoglycan biosynthesis protein ExoV